VEVFLDRGFGSRAKVEKRLEEVCQALDRAPGEIKTRAEKQYHETVRAISDGTNMKLVEQKLQQLEELLDSLLTSWGGK
jgi:hypothetical protein